MTQTAVASSASPLVRFAKVDASTPCLIVEGRHSLAIKGGTTIDGFTFVDDTPVAFYKIDRLEAGSDYAVVLDREVPLAVRLDGAPSPDIHFAGFHFAPGGNATARAGGDDIPAINPFSLWDLHFRPACPDPRGMTLVDGVTGKFWCDIYLCGTDHLKQGSSRFGAVIADGKTETFDYPTAVAALAHHGKGLLDLYEFPAAAFGVTEKTSHDGDPVHTGLDAPRTSRFGLMQATGNMWVWGHDGDPDTPRASLFGGSWWRGGVAGSRYAGVGYWPDYSSGDLGARGRSDHLQLG